MKRRLLTLGVLLGLGLLASMAWVGVTHATDVRTGDKPLLASDETTDNSLYVAGNSVVVAGTVRGDLFCAGSNIDVTGTVEGDVICAGQSVRITGRVFGDIRAAGQNVEVTSEVDGAVTVFGESIVLGPEARVGRDVTLGGARVHLEGAIGRDVLGAAETIVMAAHIGRNFDAEVAALTIDSSTTVAGDLNYRSPVPAEIAQGATISGATRYTERASGEANTGTTMQFWGAVYGLIAMLMIGLALWAIAPRSLDALGAAVRTRTVASFAAGAAALILMPVVGVLLLITLFGIPLGLLLILLWVAGLLTSLVVGAYAVGWITIEKLGWPNRGRRLASLFIGLLIASLVGLVPVVGGVLVFLVMLCGLGAIAVVATGHLWPKKVIKAKS
jgi:cytoskeletal protein CcmA (bactofilin family)